MTAPDPSPARGHKMRFSNRRLVAVAAGVVAVAGAAWAS